MGVATESSREELIEELHRQQEEVLRLRDLLIARDAELGAARGRAAELEQGTMRLAGLLAKARSLVPGAVWTAGAGLRSMGSRRR